MKNGCDGVMLETATLLFGIAILAADFLTRKGDR